MPLSLCRRQDLACGLYELKPKDSAAADGGGAGPSLLAKDDEEDEDEKVQLRMPSQQSPAVTRAKRQGRSLIEPLGEERSKRKDREDGEDG